MTKPANNGVTEFRLGAQAAGGSYAGGNGDDVFSAAAGNQTYLGQNGDDVFQIGGVAGLGTDTYTGGRGADAYVVYNTSVSGAVTPGAAIITDFNLEQGDQILPFKETVGWWNDGGQGPTFIAGQIGDQRAAGDDLVLSDGVVTITLQDFFTINAEAIAGLSNAQVANLIFDDPWDEAGVTSQAQVTNWHVDSRLFSDVFV